MSAPRQRFNLGDPFPESGIVTPDVFPNPRQEGNEQLNLYDIFEGRIPMVRRGQSVREGWLQIAYGNGEGNYSRPDTIRMGRKAITAVEINVDVEDATPIRRVSTVLNGGALELPAFNGHSFRFAEGSELVKVTPVEQAIAFSGITEIKDAERIVWGIHFASGQETGWIHIGDPVEPLDHVA